MGLIRWEGDRRRDALHALAATPTSLMTPGATGPLRYPTRRRGHPESGRALPAVARRLQPVVAVVAAHVGHRRPTCPAIQGRSCLADGSSAGRCLSAAVFERRRRHRRAGRRRPPTRGGRRRFAAPGGARPEHVSERAPDVCLEGRRSGRRPAARTRCSIRREGEAAWRDLSRACSMSLFVWDTTSVADGRYLLRVRATDSPTNSADRVLSGDRESDPFEWTTRRPHSPSESCAPGHPIRLTVRVAGHAESRFSSWSIRRPAPTGRWRIRWTGSATRSTSATKSRCRADVPGACRVAGDRPAAERGVADRWALRLNDAVARAGVPSR